MKDIRITNAHGSWKFGDLVAMEEGVNLFGAIVELDADHFLVQGIDCGFGSLKDCMADAITMLRPVTEEQRVSYDRHLELQDAKDVETTEQSHGSAMTIHHREYADVLEKEAKRSNLPDGWAEVLTAAYTSIRTLSDYLDAHLADKAGTRDADEDAARYRFLRDLGWFEAKYGEFEYSNDVMSERLSKDLDACIDAAMATGRGSKS